MLSHLKRISKLRLHRQIPATAFRSHSALPEDCTTEPLTKPQLKKLVLGQYYNGAFSDLVQNVVALPSVLLAACRNLSCPGRCDDEANSIRSIQSPPLIDAVAKHFSVADMGSEIAESRFDVGSCCVKTTSPRDRVDPLVLPNLKLKVLIEAIRMVLEIVNDERFVTFSYGGRIGMGRHTAIRYLKNSVQNPTWWFTVSFNHDKFSACNVDRLCLFIGKKVKDKKLIDLIKSLFECGVVRIELGTGFLGKGFPQECGLCAILINIYFDGLDREIQERRASMNKENANFNSDELVSPSNVFFKPVKIYVVRYLDEILVIASGSKKLTMDFKNWLVSSLERNLDLKVDRVRTAIHSAVSEKISFVGMELQAVPPSVLRPPMSEKAIRARKKYLRQKEVKALELRNARERNRRMLGLKVFRHVLKKFKQSGGFKFEFQIENEVREISRTWADEVVKEFLGSLEERWHWHRLLSGGEFLSLKHIRDQLPHDLVDAYDKFQEQVNKHLTPVKQKKALEEEQRRVEEEERKQYDMRTVDDLTRLCMKVSAPIELVRKAVRLAGFTNNMGRPRPISLLTALEDADIIKWYAGIGKRWLDFFCCCHNFKMVKIVVSYHLRFSCILTLADKHGSTKLETIRHFTKDLKVTDLEGNEELYFPTEKGVKMMGDRNLSDPKPVDGALTLALVRLAYEDHLHSCVAHFCDRTDTILYRIRLLQNRLNLNPSKDEAWVPGIGAIQECLNQKCLPLCSDHVSDLYMGKITLQDIDCTSIVDVN